MTWATCAGECRCSKSFTAGSRAISRGDLLYLTPVIPSRTGNGLAMRAAAVLQALAPRYRVSLLVVPLYASPAPEIPPDLAALCAATALVPSLASAPRRRLPFPFDGLRRTPAPPYGIGQSASVQRAAEAFRGKRFDVVHHFRLATLPFGAAYQKGRWGHTPSPDYSSGSGR